MENGHFHSYTFGTLDLNRVRDCVLSFMKEEANREYRLLIGTDSEAKNGEGVEFITALVVHRVGSGGIYFWRRKHEDKKYVLKTRIYEEAVLSLSCAGEILEVFKEDGIGRLDLEIHVDIGQKGETRELISEITGMVKGSGFMVATKPYSYAASKVADSNF